MQKKILSLLIVFVALTSFTPVAYGAMKQDSQTQIAVWQGYVVQLQKLIDLCQAQIRILQAMDASSQQSSTTKPTVTAYSVTVPDGSSVKQPKSQMTIGELRQFGASLWDVHTSMYGNVLDRYSEQQVIDLLNINGYKVVSEKI